MDSMLKKLLQRSVFFRTIRGRQIVSLWASRLFEKSGIRQLFGVNLVAAAVMTGVISPQAENLLSQMTLVTKTRQTPIKALTDTKTTFETPLANFKISQLYSYWHPGIDMTAPEGTPIYAIEAGTVEAVNTHLWGYGKHVIINHGHDFKSLYAHLSEINTAGGLQVGRGELIGRIGATGWATGDHLHFEVYYQNVPVNPLEVLPIKPEEIVYDGIMWKNTAPSATSAVSLATGN